MDRSEHVGGFLQEHMQKVTTRGFERIKSAFSQSQLSALTTTAEELTRTERKAILRDDALSSHPVLGPAAKLCEVQLTRPDGAQAAFVPDTAIVKYYDAEDEQVASAAYDFHEDPTIFNGVLVLCSVTGEALLEVKDVHGDPHSFHCIPNTVAILLANNGRTFENENPLQRVSKPYKGGGRRYFIFFGMQKPLVYE
jgi:hypothetical protein